MPALATILELQRTQFMTVRTGARGWGTHYRPEICRTNVDSPPQAGMCHPTLPIVVGNDLDKSHSYASVRESSLPRSFYTDRQGHGCPHGHDALGGTGLLRVCSGIILQTSALCSCGRERGCTASKGATMERCSRLLWRERERRAHTDLFHQRARATSASAAASKASQHTPAVPQAEGSRSERIERRVFVDPHPHQERRGSREA
jgi:hypothetical protein